MDGEADRAARAGGWAVRMSETESYMHIHTLGVGKSAGIGDTTIPFRTSSISQCRIRAGESHHQPHLGGEFQRFGVSSITFRATWGDSPLRWCRDEVE